MHTILEHNAKKKIPIKMFDQVWYEGRISMKQKAKEKKRAVQETRNRKKMLKLVEENPFVPTADKNEELPRSSIDSSGK